MFGRAVGRVTWGTELAEHRRDVDDPAAGLIRHVTEGRLGEEIHAIQVGIDDIIPFGVVGIAHKTQPRDAGVVDIGFDSNIQRHGYNG